MRGSRSYASRSDLTLLHDVCRMTGLLKFDSRSERRVLADTERRRLPAHGVIVLRIERAAVRDSHANISNTPACDAACKCWGNRGRRGAMKRATNKCPIPTSFPQPPKKSSTRQRLRCPTLPDVAWRSERMERAMGIEPTAQAWEAWVLPLYDARNVPDSSRPRHPEQSALSQ